MGQQPYVPKNASRPSSWWRFDPKVSAAALVRSHLWSVQCDQSSLRRGPMFSNPLPPAVSQVNFQPSALRDQVESGSPRGRLSEAYVQLSDGSSSPLSDAGSMIRYGIGFSGARAPPPFSSPFRQHLQQPGLIVKQGGSRLRSFALAPSFASVFYQLLNKKISGRSFRRVAVVTIR
jgi:hypothetical protein